MQWTEEVAMSHTEAEKRLVLAKKHLERVLVAWDDPTDWADLSLYGFYCLEASIVAAAWKVGVEPSRSHPGKAKAAHSLQSHGLPDVADLLSDLNVARKAAAYGDVDFPELDAEDLAARIEEYVEAVATLLADESDESGESTDA